MTNDDLWPFPMMDLVCAAGIVVDAAAQRFMDEGLGGVTMANAIARQADPLGATVIFDAAIWSGPGREYLIPANPTLVTNGGTLHAAQDLRSLAARVGLPAEALEQTVSNHNAAVDAAATDSLTPRRSARSYKPWPIRQAPFHAVKLCAGITYTMGGIAVNAEGRVLNLSDEPMTGLYAAGCAAGGVAGGALEQVTSWGPHSFHRVCAVSG